MTKSHLESCEIPLRHHVDDMLVIICKPQRNSFPQNFLKMYYLAFLENIIVIEKIIIKFLRQHLQKRGKCHIIGQSNYTIITNYLFINQIRKKANV